jgi:hypothetical protein
MYPAKIGVLGAGKNSMLPTMLKKLEKAGLIRRLKRSNFVDYELTERGQNFLVSCEGGFLVWGFSFASGFFQVCDFCVRVFIQWAI